MRSQLEAIQTLVGVAAAGVYTFPAWCAASTITLTFSADDASLTTGGPATTLHVFAEVTEGAMPGNGIYAYALNILFDTNGILQIEGVQQLGDPNPFFSDPGEILPDGLHDVYGGDGGFFADQNRGLAAPFEILALQVRGVSAGSAGIAAGPADSAALLGVPEGILLQEAGSIQVEFGAGPTFTVESGVTGDFDLDGDVDLNDYLAFVDCHFGPNVSPTPPPPTTGEECRAAFDFDSDLDIDAADFAEFQAVFLD